MKYKVNWRLRLMLRIIKIFQKPLHKADLTKLKTQSNSRFTAYFYDVIRIRVFRVEDYPVHVGEGSFTIRVYYPDNKDRQPAILFFHGGGFVVGGITSYDHFCRRLCKTANCIIASVDYRLAPNHKFPTAHNDAWHSLQWLVKEAMRLKIDVNSIAVMGDSAGGNLAAYLSFMARDHKIKLKSQILIYPVLDFRVRERIYFKQFLLGKEESKWFAEQLLSEKQEVNDPRLSIILQEDLKNLPPTLLIQAEYDHLNDEIEEFGAMLSANDVQCHADTFPGTFHGYITMFNWSRISHHSLQRIVNFLSVNSISGNK